MYEDNERKISWLGILKRIIKFIIIIIIIFAIILLITKCTRSISNNRKNKIIEPEQVSLKTQIDSVQEATLKYLNKENLPTEINASKTIKLKYLINKNLINNVEDANGNVCDTSNSYSEVTRLENNYAVKTSLKCGKNSDYKIIYIGCFDNCENSGICVGEETRTGGICTNSNNKVENPEENTPNTNDNSSSSSNSNSQNGASNSNSKSTYNKKSKSTTTNKANSNENTNKTLYQYSRCTDQYVCSEGTLTNGNVCATEKEYTYIGDVVTTTSTIPASTSTEYFTKTSNAKNSSSVTYKYIRYDKNYGYVFTKYSCNQGTISGTSCVISKPTTQCKNAGFIYNSSTGKCTKTKVETLLTPAETKNVCEVMWSYDEAVAGWTRTGNTK